MKIYLMQAKYQILIILSLTTLAFVNIFGNGFVIDDPAFIVNWQAPRDFNMVELLKGEVPQGHEGVYRPVRSLLYAFYYQIYGINPFGYHLHSLIVHILSTILVYLIINRLTKSNLTAFIAGLLFGLHPIHTESITYISASMEMTGVVFMLLSFYLYLMSKQLTGNREQFCHLTSVTCNLVSLVFATLAYFTYEMTLTLPILILSYELIVRREKLKNNLKVILPFFSIAVVYGLVRVFLVNATTRGPYLADSFYLTMLTMTKVIVKYLELLIVPLNLANNHVISPGIEAFVYRNYRVEAIRMQSYLDWQILLSVAVILAVILLAIKSIKKNPLVTFAIFWLFIALLPVSEIVPQGSMLNEKALYISSFGFILILAMVFSKLLQLKSKSLIYRLSLPVFCLLLIFYGYQTYLRNFDWKDNITLWSRDIAVYPTENAYAYFQLGNAYTDNKEYQKGIEEYRQSLKINPGFVVGLASIARNYDYMGDSEKAIEYYQKALQMDSNFWEARRNLSNIYLKQAAVAKKVRFQRLEIDVPRGWQVKQTDRELIIKDNNDEFQMAVTIERRNTDISINSYLQVQTDTLGRLVNQGFAWVPNFDQAYVRMWEDQGIKKDQFFLFKEDQVIMIMVYPVDSPLMKIFDNIVQSIQFTK